MDDDAPKSDAQEDLLERFRQDWLSEVERNKRTGSGPKDEAQSRVRDKASVVNAPAVQASSRRKDDFSEEMEPRAYHDLPNDEERLVLGKERQTQDRTAAKEPSSALEHYEHAVEKENQGQLGDSVKHYRKAFRLDAGVHEAYRKKYFPPSSLVKSKSPNPNPSSAPVTVPNPAHHLLHGGAADGLSPSLKRLLEDFSTSSIEAAPPATSISPQDPCLLAQVPEEILTQILTALALTGLASLGKMAQACKRLAYVVLTEETIWRRVAEGEEFGFSAMHYDFACDVDGHPLVSDERFVRYVGTTGGAEDEAGPTPTPEEHAAAFSSLTDELLHSTYGGSWRQMFRLRPRIRFNGCYISTVNYTRPGANSTNTLTWGAPVHVVTYFRYLRFFRDGTVISLLTTNEPADVVHHLIKDNMHDHHHSNTLPSSVMKDALRGRWRLSSPASSDTDPLSKDSVEPEGNVHIETEGVVPKYTYKMLLGLAHAGKGARNNKLAWKSFWSYNRLTDDWAEFLLKNDRAFYWSRVKSYDVRA